MCVCVRERERERERESEWEEGKREVVTFIYLSVLLVLCYISLIKPFVFLRLGALEISYYNDDDEEEEEEEEDGYDDDDDNVLRYACCSPKLYRQVIVAWSPCVCMCV